MHLRTGGTVALSGRRIGRSVRRAVVVLRAARRRVGGLELGELGEGLLLHNESGRMKWALRNERDGLLTCEAAARRSWFSVSRTEMRARRSSMRSFSTSTSSRTANIKWLLTRSIACSILLSIATVLLPEAL